MEDYVCPFCKKILLIDRSLLTENDIIECSNCKNKFHFLPEKLKANQVKQKNDIKKILVSYLLRVILFIPFILLYYFIKKNNLLLYIGINYIFFILVIIIYLLKKNKLINYFHILKDKFIKEFDFYLILYELIITIISNIIFLILN